MTNAHDDSAMAKVAAQLKHHLTLSISAGLVVLSVAHIVIVARFHPQTILALLSVADRTQVLVSTFTIAAVTIASSLLLGALSRDAHKLRLVAGLPFFQQLGAFLLIMILAIGALQLPWSVLIFLSVVTIVIAVNRRLENRRKASTSTADIGNDPTWERRVSVMLSFAMATVLLSLLYQPWVPQENIELQTRKTIVANVIGTQGDFTLLLSNGEVEWVRTANIQSRAVCEYAGGENWVTKRFHFGVNYPKCVD